MCLRQTPSRCICDFTYVADAWMTPASESMLEHMPCQLPVMHRSEICMLDFPPLAGLLSNGGDGPHGSDLPLHSWI